MYGDFPTFTHLDLETDIYICMHIYILTDIFSCEINVKK